MLCHALILHQTCIVTIRTKTTEVVISMSVLTCSIHFFKWTHAIHSVLSTLRMIYDASMLQKNTFVICYRWINLFLKSTLMTN